MVDSDFLNPLVMTVYPYVKEDELQQIKMQFDILLHDYDVMQSTCFDIKAAGNKQQAKGE